MTTIESKRNQYIEALDKTLDNNSEILKIAENMISLCFENGNKLIFCGNGGSASDASHIAAEFMKGRSRTIGDESIYIMLPAISMTDNMALITSIGNDIDYSYLFTLQLETVYKKGDLIILFSTSGTSENISNMGILCANKEIPLVTFTGIRGKDLVLATKFATLPVIIESNDTQIIQEITMFIWHYLWIAITNKISIKNS